MKGQGRDGKKYLQITNVIKYMYPEYINNSQVSIMQKANNPTEKVAK